MPNKDGKGPRIGSYRKGNGTSGNRRGMQQSGAGKSGLCVCPSCGTRMTNEGTYKGI
jgi:hypothetical protein